MATLPDVLAEKIPNHYDGDLEDFTAEFVQGKLDETVDKIANKWGTLVAARLASGALSTRLYEAVVIRIAARVFENARGFRKENEGQYGYELSPAVASGTLWFTDEDVEDLTGVPAKPKPGSGPIGTATVGRHRAGWV